MNNSTGSKSQAAYPWAELYDLESRLRKGPKQAGAGQGRPSRAFVRRHKTMLLTDEEVSDLNTSAFQIKQALLPGTVTQSQVCGLAVRLLYSRLEHLPTHATGWEEVVRAIFVEDDRPAGQ